MSLDLVGLQCRAGHLGSLRDDVDIGLRVPSLCCNSPQQHPMRGRRKRYGNGMAVELRQRQDVRIDRNDYTVATALCASGKHRYEQVVLAYLQKGCAVVDTREVRHVPQVNFPATISP